MARRQTYVALLRGINLGSRNRVSMPELRTLLEELGAEDVSTYVQSGNVVLKSSDSPATLARKIEGRLERDLGLKVTVLVRTKAQLKKLRAGNPFARRGKESALHVTLLADSPARSRVRELEQNEFPPDEFRVVGQDVYLHCPNGYGRSKLSNAFFEKQLGVAATTRNWKTVSQLAELAAA